MKINKYPYKSPLGKKKYSYKLQQQVYNEYLLSNNIVCMPFKK